MYDLYIGNKNYSSWSLRPWIVFKHLGIAFNEHLIPFHDEKAWEAFRTVSPNKLVPLLKDGDTMVWDSLAIVEYLAERHEGVWPTAPKARSFARSAAAEMHSGFSTLRTLCGMNVGVRATLKSKPEALLANVARLCTIWNEGLSTYGGPFLAGKTFTAADAFFCPIAFRMQSYDIALDANSDAYMKRLVALPGMQEWYQAGVAEPFRDAPHDAELTTYCTVTSDLRAPAKA